MFRRFPSSLLAAIVLTVALAMSAAPVQACPGCKEATSEQGQNLARAYSLSILFMMPIPFIILGSFGGYVYYTVRKRDTDSAATNTSTSESPKSLA